MTDQLLSSCGPVQTFKYNASAKIISAKLYQRTDGTRYIAVEWSASGCITFHEQECSGLGYNCDLTVIVKASWGDLYGRYEYHYPGTSIQAGSVNIGASSSSPLSSYTVEVTTQSKCYCISAVPILTDEATCSCIITP